MEQKPTTQEPGNKSGIYNAIAIAIFGLLAIAFLYFSSKSSPVNYTPPGGTPLDTSATDLAQEPPKIEEKKNKEEAQRKFNTLRKKFSYKKDEFRETGWYTHGSQKNAGWGKRVLVHVNKDGFIYLSSWYRQSDWMFHDYMILLCEGRKAATVEPSSDNVYHQVNDGILEHNHYTDSSEEAIRLVVNSGKKPVKIRFEGAQYHNDFTLSLRDKQAIIEAYELSQAIKALK